jgi:hypothetical protein
MTEKTYINGCFINEHVFPDGSSVLNVSVPYDAIDKLFADLRAVATPRGLALRISKRKSPAISQKTGKQFATHTLSVDTYAPKQSAQAEPEAAPW